MENTSALPRILTVFLVTFAGLCSCQDTSSTFRSQFDSAASVAKQWNINQVYMNTASPMMELIPEDPTWTTRSVENGELRLTCQSNEQPFRDFTMLAGACGRLDTKKKHAFLYGAVEWKVKFALDVGSDYFLLEPAGCHDRNKSQQYIPGVCIGEYGSVLNQIIGFHLSRRGPSEAVLYSHETIKTGQEYQVAGQGLDLPKQHNFSDFNTYGVKWGPNRVEWFVNSDSVRVTTDANRIPSSELFIAMETYDDVTFKRYPDPRPASQKTVTVSSVRVRKLTDQEKTSKDSAKSTWTWD